MRIGGTGAEPGSGDRAGGAGAVAACLAVVLGALVVLHVDGVGTVDPVVQTLSDYVALPGGYALLGVAAVALAAAVGLVGAGLRAAGLPDPGAPTALLAAASGGLVAAAVFPTNDPGTLAGPVANLHRAAGAVVLVALPVATWMIARRAARTPAWGAAAPGLTRLAAATAGLSAAFLLSNVPIVITGSPILANLGALQRVLYAVMLLLLLTTARATRSAVVAARASAPVEAAVGIPVAAAVGAPVGGRLEEAA
jgi:uncharacterized protein DUF998